MQRKLSYMDITVQNLTCWWWVTCREGVSDESRVTATIRAVVLDCAAGMHSAHSGARVLAFVPYTGKVCWTVWVDRTLRFALNIRISHRLQKTLKTIFVQLTSLLLNPHTASCWGFEDFESIWAVWKLERQRKYMERPTLWLAAGCNV